MKSARPRDALRRPRGEERGVAAASLQLTELLTTGILACNITCRRNVAVVAHAQYVLTVTGASTSRVN